MLRPAQLRVHNSSRAALPAQAPHLNGGSMGCASSKASEPTAADAIALSPKPADSAEAGDAAAVQPAVQAAPSDAVSLQPAGSG